MSDLTLVCQDCHNEFIYTQDEASFYQSKNLPEPKFCLICRSKHRAQNNDPGKNAKPTASSF